MKGDVVPIEWHKHMCVWHRWVEENKKTWWWRQRRLKGRRLPTCAWWSKGIILIIRRIISSSGVWSRIVCVRVCVRVLKTVHECMCHTRCHQPYKPSSLSTVPDLSVKVEPVLSNDTATGWIEACDVWVHMCPHMHSTGAYTLD